MDCNAGAQIGRQLQKDALATHGGLPLHADPAAQQQDALMRLQMQQQQQAQGPGLAQPQADWGAAYGQQAMRQQHEMEMAFQQQQQQGMAPSAAVASQPQQPHLQHPVPGLAQQQYLTDMQSQMAMMGQMSAMSGLQSAMMVPRTQYQPTAINIPKTATATTTNSAVNLSAAGDSAWAEQLSQQQWAQDYESVQTFTAAGAEEATVEELTKQSNFYAFMDDVSSKRLLIDEEKGEVVAGPGPEAEVPEDTEYVKEWAAAEGMHVDPALFQRDPAAAMQAMAAAAPPDAIPETGLEDPDGVEEWAEEYAEMQKRLEQKMNNTDYPFEPNNLYRDDPEAFARGRELLQLGSLAEAALAFEAVCQADNDNAEAWKLLGRTQAENEKDYLAIIALNNARRVNCNDLEVHALLSVSHTNEHNTDAAVECLKQWLVHHPQYEQLGSMTFEPTEEDLAINDAFFFVDPTRYREVSTLYQAAIELNPTDGDLYNNLGVLYNITHEFDLATEAFRRAVELHPEDAKLWNKLGASYANGSKPEEALAAYNRALDINPGYVRAMYNMAVAYSNLSRYPQAGKQIVRAIKVQEGGTNPSGEGTAAAVRGMWELLRMVLNLMDRQDLVELSYNQDVTPFVREFGLEGLV